MLRINKDKPKTSSVAFCVVKVTVIVLLRPGAKEVGSKAICISLLGNPEKKIKLLQILRKEDLTTLFLFVFSLNLQSFQGVSCFITFHYILITISNGFILLHE